MTGVSTTACEREIRDLFVMVSPEGERRDREAVLAAVRDGYGARTGFDIEIRAVDPVAAGDDLAVVRYEEWQTGDRDGTTGRISTACFRAGDAPEGVVWIGLQETWLDGGDADDDRDG